MDDNRQLVAQFDQSRAHLRAVAYRMLGSASEADDAVQEAWLRLAAPTPTRCENLGGWLTTVVAGCAWTCCARAGRGGRSRWRTCRPRSSSRDAGATPSRRRCWPTRSAWRCWWCWTRWRRPSGWRSCCTTCSRALRRDRPIVGRSPAAARQLASRARRRVQGGGGARRRPGPPARGRRRLPGRRARRRLRGAAGGARSGRGAARRRRHFEASPDRGTAGHQERHLDRPLSFARFAPFARLAMVNGAAGILLVMDGEPTRSWASPW